MKDLTYEEIMNLDGRKLDVAFATVRGIQLIINNSECVYYDREIDELVYPGYWLRNGRYVGGGLIPLPTYHADDYHWSLCEELRKNKYDVDITFRSGLEYGCRIAPCGEFNTENVIFVSAPSPRLAIYRAYLLLKHKQQTNSKEEKNEY